MNVNDLGVDVGGKIMKVTDVTKIGTVVGCVESCLRLQRDINVLVKCAVKRQMEFILDKCELLEEHHRG